MTNITSEQFVEVNGEKFKLVKNAEGGHDFICLRCGFDKREHPAGMTRPDFIKFEYTRTARLYHDAHLVPLERKMRVAREFNKYYGLESEGI